MSAAESGSESGAETSPRAGLQNLRAIYMNGVCSQAMDSLTTGAILVGLALELGASNMIIGVIGAIPFLANLFQLPAIFLIERVQDRKKVVVWSAILGRSCWLAVAFVPLLYPSPTALALLIGAVTLRYSFGAFTACAWNSWLRDLIPTESLGRFMGFRLFLMTAAAVLVGLGAAALIDLWQGDPARLSLYAIFFVVGGLFGVAGAVLYGQVPKAPLCAQEVANIGLTVKRNRLASPFRNRNFRSLMSFLATWHFAANLATPFFVAFMLTKLGYELTFVILLTLFSQAVTAASFKIWGRYADNFSHKGVMGTCGGIFVFCLLGWTFVSFPERHAYTTHLLFVLHGLMGLAIAGINLTTSSLSLKLAPPEEATSFLAVNSMVNSAAAGCAPLIGGLLADFFAERQLSLVLRWRSLNGTLDFNTFIIGHWDFLFLLAFLAGLFALNRLSRVEEPGSQDPDNLLRELMVDTSQALRTLSSLDGLRDTVSAPFVMAMNLIKRP